VVAGDGHGSGHNVLRPDLPYLELSPIYNTYNFWHENWHVTNGTTVRTRVDIVRLSRQPEHEADTGRRTPRGRRPRPTWATPDSPPSLRGELGRRAGRLGDRLREGSRHLPRRDDDGPEPGTKGENTNVAFANISDGLAFTVALGEKRDSQGWDAGGWAEASSTR